MRIELPKNDSFCIRQDLIAGELCSLVYPLKGDEPDWGDSNKIFRSSIWNSLGEPVSLGFKKFVNLYQKPSFEPMPEGPVTFVEKMDGSLLCVSKYKGQLIHRTRGTFDASCLENGHEIKLLKRRYPLAFDNIVLDTERYSLLFEWVSPSNTIVLKYPKPDIKLIGVVCHADYRYWGQYEVDILAEDIGVKRPQRFKFDSLEDAFKTVKDWEGLEGVVCYSHDGQTIKKIKSDWYCDRHYLMTGFRSMKKAINLWLEVGSPLTYDDFRDGVEKLYDYEAAEVIDDYIVKIIDELREIHLVYFDAGNLLSKQGDDRKEKALWIEEHSNCLFKQMAFLHLSGKELDSEYLAKILKKRLK